ncbi:rRNA pseudouridine synthase [Candidatus Curtissbacteria bacterium]|nr:rRNA pseudouridine synthase [Candidatus Curtissbacteria bacterium]
MKVRINKYLANMGVAARRKVDLMIAGGKVTVGGKKAVLGMMIDPVVDKVVVSGKTIGQTSEENHKYVILNKPRGVTSTVADQNAERTVIDLVPGRDRLYPVGRLDKDSEGLIILTNDGELTNRLTHPKFHVAKTYIVEVQGNISENKANIMRSGVKLVDGWTKEAEVTIIQHHSNKSKVEIVLFEGRKRQIRRMAEKLHLHVLSLRRIKMGSVELGDLQEGKWRNLTASEIAALKKQAGL